MPVVVIVLGLVAAGVAKWRRRSPYFQSSPSPAPVVTLAEDPA